MLVLAIVCGCLAFVLIRTLGDAALFFYNADQAVERRDELVERRFRVQGTPVGEPVDTEVRSEGRFDPAVVFPIAFNGVTIDVAHVGNPAESFQQGVPVVLEGLWRKGPPPGLDSVQDGANDGWHFLSSDMIVKHDNEYRNDYRQGLDAAKGGGDTATYP